jgi:NADH:ubiquinone oxidoreductase subunit 3 (subunit A)
LFFNFGIVGYNLFLIWYIWLFCKSSCLLVVVLFLLVLFLINKKVQIGKTFLLLKQTQTIYECGFQPFNKLIQFYDINFFIIAILFLIFDLELIFLFPCIFLIKYSLLNLFLFLLIV